MCRCKIISLLLLLTLGLGVLSPALAQGGPDGWATYNLNMRIGPGADFTLIVALPADTGLMFEARSADLSWLLARTADGVYRGWVASLYVGYAEGFGSPSHLPISDEIVNASPVVAVVPVAAPPASDPAAPASESVPAGMDLDPATVAYLLSTPVVPAIGPRVSEIYAQGQALGNNPRVFTQVGECNTMSQAFMVPFGAGTYDLGPYGHLQTAINHFMATPPVPGVSGSFWYKGVAMTTGLTSLAVIDPAFSNPAICGNQSLLECEYERSKPSIALIHLGLYDVYWLTPEQYELAMRRIIEISIAHGVIPVLTTFPTHPGDMAPWPNDLVTRNHNRAAFNTTVINLGREYGVPVMNLWLATNTTQWHGLLPGDFQHLSASTDGNFFTAFNGDENLYGFTMWNLVALQTLDALLKSGVGQ